MLFTAHAELQQANDALTAANKKLRQTEDELRMANSRVTEEKKAMTRQRDRVKNLLDIAGVMILALDKEGKVTLINRRGCEILGYTGEEIIGSDWIGRFFPEETREKLKKAYPRLIAGEIRDFRHYENPVLTRDGGKRQILWSNTLIKDAEGRITGILSSGEDITERTRAEEALKQSENKYRMLSDLSPDAILVVQDGLIRYANEAGLRLAGAPAMEQFLGRKITDLIHPEDRTDSEERMAVVQNEGKIAPFRELRIRIGDKTIPVESIGGPVTWEGQSAVQFVIRDISERKSAADELLLKNRLLNSANEELSRLNRELMATKDELQHNLAALSLREQELSLHERRLKDALAEKEVLLSEIHHRVKNNLTAFISLLSLEGSYEESAAGLALKKDLQNRARTMALIHETLYRTRQYADVDMDVYLNTLAGQVVGSFSSAQTVRTIVDAKGITLDLARATPIGLIVNELLTNSLKYGFPPEETAARVDRKDPFTIGIRMTKEEGAFLLKVSDNGVGLPPGFDITSTKTLGLKLVNFLAKHQLRAETQITVTGGTEFVFRFKE
ncbi:MAG TPA: PAS domain S-box protein [Methanoregula sp.]|nr:PAS domain S-box protein [Methanoregula sp.]